MNLWLKALIEFNKTQDKYIIPKKGSEDYKKVMMIMNSMTIKGSGNVEESILMDGYSRRVLEGNFGNIVSKITIAFVPVDRIFQILLNIHTKGQLYNVLEKYNINDLIHPLMVLHIENKTQLIQFERVKRVQLIEHFVNTNKYTYCATVDTGRLKLGTMYNNFLKSIGGSLDNIYKYHADTQNSQVFVRTFLSSNNLLTDTIEKSCLQDTKKIMESFPQTNLLIAKLVSLGTTLDSLIKGSGKNKG